MNTYLKQLFTQTSEKPGPRTMAFVLVLILLGSVLVVLNSDDIYLDNKNSATLSIPENFQAGGDGSLIIQAADANGGIAADQDVEVTLTRSSGDTVTLWEGTTNEAGIAQPTFQLPDEQGEATLHIKVGSEEFEKDVELVSSWRIIISTDKPLYQPGQTIHLRTLSYKGSPPKAQEHEITLLVQDPDGNKIFRKTLEANEYGIASYDYLLSDQLPLGNYKLTASIGEENTGVTTSEKTVTVQRYVLPKYRIQFQELESWYLVTDTVEGTINASYTFGEPIQGSVKVAAKSYYGEWDTIATKEGQLQDGLFDFSIPLDPYSFVGLDINKGNAYLELNATITDTSGHVEEKSLMLTITQSPITLLSLGDSNIDGSRSTYHFIARYPDGTPVESAELDIELWNGTVNSWGGDYTNKTSYTRYTDERGVTKLDFLYHKTNARFTVTATKDQEQSLPYYLYLDGEEEGLKVLPKEQSYPVGEEAEFEVFYFGDGGTRNIFYELTAGGFILLSGHTELEDGKAELSFTVSPEMSPMLECRVYKIQPDLSVLMDSTMVAVGQEEPLNVKIIQDKPIYRPGGEVGIQFQVKDGEYQGVPAALGISGVDLSVYELQERFTGYQDIYFSLEQEYTEPKYQIVDYVMGTGSALPTTPTQHVSEEDLDFGVRVFQSGGAHQDNADDAKDQSQSSLVGIILVAGLIGYLSLFFLAAKYKQFKSPALTLIIVISLVLPMALMVSFMDSELEKEDTMYLDDGNWEPENGFGDWGGMWADDMAFDGALEGADAPQATGIRDKSSDDPQAGGAGQNIAEPDHVRQYFPETWVWEPTLITDQSGEAALTLTAPDTITTWRLDVFASTIDGKMGQGSANVTVFQEFFVEPDIPVEVVRNDEFPLNIMVYNYHSENQNITLELEEADWFELLEGQREQTVTVAPASVAGVEYRIKATQVGENNVSITAGSTLMADKVIRPVRVVPDGQQTKHIINGELTDNITVDQLIELARDRVPGSENAYLKLQGSMDAVTVEGAEDYIHFVSGCGEQSMSTLSINILAYAIVKEQGSPEKLFEYETITSQGIQHELTFLLPAKNGEGRGIVWFPSDEDVHPWLTSWGLLTFQDAIDAGFEIDESIITDMQSYLLSQQAQDGSFEFPERGLYETTNSILRSKVVATTAYITRALLYSGYPADSSVEKAMDFIENNIRDHWDDPYTLAVSLIVLEDGDGIQSVRDDIANRLVELKTVENGSASWESGTNIVGTSEPRGWGGSNTHLIETTAYAVMALSKHGDTASASQGVKYLLTNRIGGGFFSTQDTVVAFQALTRWGEVSVDELTVSVFVNDQLAQTQTIDEENADLTYLIDLRPWVNDTNEIRLESTGSGSLLYQLYFEEYLPWKELPQDGVLVMDVSYDATNISVNDAITATLELSYNGEAPQLKMILVELRAPVGFSFNGEEFVDMVEAGSASHYELEGRELFLYLTDVKAAEDYQYSYSLTANKPIKATLQGVSAHDMYNPMLRDVEQPVEIESHL